MGALLLGPMLIIQMETENDAIIAKNRLRFLGICVNEEKHCADEMKIGRFATKDYVNQGGREDDV